MAAGRHGQFAHYDYDEICRPKLTIERSNAAGAIKRRSKLACHFQENVKYRKEGVRNAEERRLDAEGSGQVGDGGPRT